MPTNPDNQGASQLPQSYAFIANIAHLADVTSYILAPAHELRHATHDETNFLCDAVKQFFPSPISFYKKLWECRWPPKGALQLLPEAEWRYFVIGFTGTNYTIDELKSAFDIAPLELEILFTLAFMDSRDLPKPTIIWKGSRIFQTLNNAHLDASFFHEVRLSDLTTIKNIYERMQHHDDALIDMKKIARQFGELKDLPKKSELRFLGYFAILESMLTHSPKPGDRYESITRQVKRKIALLDNRWSPTLDYTPFEEARPEKIWEIMYAYRSSLAHGDNPNFRTEFRVLKSPEEALRLIRECSKAVARQILEEPRLLLDLREC